MGSPRPRLVTFLGKAWPPRRVQDGPRRLQEGSKTPKTLQQGPQEAPRRLQDPPRRLQDPSRCLQETPGTPPEAIKPSFFRGFFAIFCLSAIQRLKSPKNHLHCSNHRLRGLQGASRGPQELPMSPQQPDNQRTNQANSPQPSLPNEPQDAEGEGHR